MYPRISVENRTVMQTTMCRRMDCKYQKSTRIRNTSAYRLLFFAILTLWTVQQAHSSPARNSSFPRTRTREVSQRQSPGLREVSHLQNPGPREVSQRQNPGRREVSHLQNPGPREVSQRQSPGLREVSQLQNPGPREVSQRQNPGRREVSHLQNPGPREVSQRQNPGRREVSHLQNPGPREVSQPQNPEPREIASNNRESSRKETIPERRRNDGNIKFPEEHVNHRNTSTPSMVPVPMESCVGKTYCEEVENYPQDFVREILRRNDNLKIFSGSDKIQTNINNRLNPSSGAESLCTSDVKLVFPKMAETDTGEHHIILQDPASGFMQGVEIESCQTGQLGNACKIINNAIQGYKTECTQKYVYRVMAAVSKEKKGVKARVKLPSTCCCQVEFVGSGFELRSGFEKNQTPAINSRTQLARSEEISPDLKKFRSH